MTVHDLIVRLKSLVDDGVVSMDSRVLLESDESPVYHELRDDDESDPILEGNLLFYKISPLSECVERDEDNGSPLCVCGAESEYKKHINDLIAGRALVLNAVKKNPKWHKS